MTRFPSIAVPLCAALTLALGVPSCADGPPRGTNDRPIVPHVFVGSIEGSDALIAIVEGEESLVAYTCGIGDRFTTDTGWYFGLRNGEGVDLVNGVSGLKLTGNLTETGGSGTFTRTDGTTGRFTVEPARGHAGLYEHEDASNFVGLIRDNGGRTAGNAVLRTDGTGVATSPALPGSTPVTTSPTGPSTPTIPPPTGATFVTPGGLRTVPLIPIVSADKRVIRRSGPVVVFLVHGMSDQIGTKTAGAPERVATCDGPRDTPFYGRCEWGQDFLPGIFGAESSSAILSNLAGQDVTGDRFLNDPNNRPEFDETLGQTLSAGCVADPTQTEVVDPKTARHFIVPGSLQENRPFLNGFRVPPPLSAFVTWRDSTRGLVFSGRRVTRQVYAALRWYEETYKVTPGVILLAQSFGGLASRFMLSKPDPATLTGTLNVERTPLCKEDLAKMDYVRDRTIFLTTLATPHEGSYLSEFAVPLKNFIANLLADLNVTLSSSEAGKLFRGLDELADELAIAPENPETLARIRLFLTELIPQLSSAALTDMKLATMVRFNTGPIAPGNARRTGASPILGAAKALIPIYATLGRSPGSDAFDSPDILGGVERYNTKRAKAQGWLTGTMAVDVGIRQVSSVGYGDATVEPYRPFQKILDRRKRLFDTSPAVAQVADRFATDIANVVDLGSPWFQGKFGSGPEAVLKALQGGGPGPHLLVPIHTNQDWKIGFDGTTMEVPIPGLRCQGRTILFDYDELARLLVQEFGTTEDVIDAIEGKDLPAIVAAIGEAVEDTNDVAKGIADWFVSKVAALGNLPDECNATPDNSFDVFSIGEIANWKPVLSKGQIPAPVWIGLGNAVSDGEMDTDGAVHSASALGFTLGVRPFFFEHDRKDAPGGQIGSWYRLYDNPVTEKYHHGMLYEFDVGEWFRDAFLEAQVGPLPRERSFSGWPE